MSATERFNQACTRAFADRCLELLRLEVDDALEFAAEISATP